MNILVICSRIPFPLKDGGAIATYKIIEGLVHSGNQVSLLSLNTKKHFVSQEQIEREFSFCKKVQTFFLDTDIKVGKAFFNLFSSKSYNLSRFWNKEFMDLLQSQVDTYDYDIIQFEGLFVAEYATHLKTTIPMVLRQHNVEHQIWERLAKNEKSVIKAFYLKLLARRMKKFELEILPSFAGIVAISETDSTFFKEHYNKEIITIPVAVQVKKLDIIHNHSVYHIGSMEWLPNKEGVLWFLENVWNIVLHEVPQAHFYVAGKGIVATDFKKYSNLTVSGEVKSLEDFTSNKKILVVPLLSGGGIRVKIIEAMAHGKWVVSTSQGIQGLQEGYYIPVSNTAAGFAKHVIDLLHTTDNKVITETNYDYVDTHFNEAVLSSRLNEFYNNLLHSA